MSTHTKLSPVRLSILVIHGFLLLAVAIINQSCGEEKPCSCPIERPTTSSGGYSLDSTNQGGSVSTEVEVSIPEIKKLIEAVIDLKGAYNDSDIQVERTYWEILDSDPEIAQSANLFWTAACALYEITCEDPTISEEQREAEKRQIVREYQSKIDTIIQSSPSSTDTSQSEIPIDSPEADSHHYIPTPPTTSTTTEAPNIIKIAGSINGDVDTLAFSEVEVWCASCIDKSPFKIAKNGLFEGERKIEERLIDGQVKICFKYLGRFDCSWTHFRYADKISITPKFE